MGVSPSRVAKSIICCAVLQLGQAAYALEFDSDNDSPLLTEISKKVISLVQDAVKAPAGQVTEASRRLDNGASKMKTEARLSKLREQIVSLEKGDLKRLRFTVIAPPSVIRINDDLDITLLVIFDLTGQRLHSGLLTMRVGQPSVTEGKITCGVELGHIALSMSHVVEDDAAPAAP